MLLSFSSAVKEEVPDNDQERGNEEAEVVGGEVLNEAFSLLVKDVY